MAKLDDEQLTQVVETLKKAQAYQRGAWAQVQEAGRKYAQMKAFGTMTDTRHGGCIAVNHSQRHEYEEQFKRLLLEEVERAFREDAFMGAAVSETLS